jgi:predicted regulator of Ras-like GTPase activity (Roadblock/LC7/MglB family)
MADLEEILARMVHQVDGCLAAAVAGMDGLVIEQQPHEGSELAGVVAEIVNALASLRTSVSEELEGGALREVIATSDRRTAYARVLGPDLFCLLVLNRTGNLGKARLYSEEAARKITGVLA